MNAMGQVPRILIKMQKKTRQTKTCYLCDRGCDDQVLARMDEIVAEKSAEVAKKSTDDNAKKEGGCLCFACILMMVAKRFFSFWFFVVYCILVAFISSPPPPCLVLKKDMQDLEKARPLWTDFCRARKERPTLQETSQRLKAEANTCEGKHHVYYSCLAFL